MIVLHPRSDHRRKLTLCLTELSIKVDGMIDELWITQGGSEVKADILIVCVNNRNISISSAASVI